MTSRNRITLIAGLLLLGTAGLARAAATSIPSDAEKRLESPRLTVPYLDYTNCPTPQAQMEAQLRAMQVPAEDRGPVIEKGGCAVASTEQAPTRVDDRYSIGH